MTESLENEFKCSICEEIFIEVCIYVDFRCVTKAIMRSRELYSTKYIFICFTGHRHQL